MIGRIKGILIEKQAPDILVDIQGVGYELLVPMTTYYQLPGIGQSILLHTHLVVREDAHLLFGFSELDDRRMFRELIRISGVGPKLALAILSGMSTTEFIHLVIENDFVGLTALPGVGKKTAQRLVVEMKDRLENWQITELSDSPSSVKQEPTSHRQLEKDAVSALIALGYSPQQASKSISKIRDQAQTSEEMIRLALKSM